MTVDTASEPSNASLSVRDAAALFAGEPEQKAQPEAKAEEPAKVEKPAKESPEATKAEADPEAGDDQPEESVEKVTIEVDGKTVELTKAELAEHYKNGLRQADYTKKTMEAAELRKQADAETAKAREERKTYAQGLMQSHAMLTAALQEQQKLDWDALLQQDPQEYLKQKHLFERRQAALQETSQRGQQLAAFERAEAKKGLLSHLDAEQQALLAKLPEWKDKEKANTEKQAIVKELIDRGFDEKRIFGETDQDGTPSLDNPGLADHKILLLARDAMLYRQMLAKASAAAKKVSSLPQKVERPGGGETQATDGRTAAMRQLDKTGSIRDAARVFEKLF